ncbi:hypothetical protein PENTCL1PPCAC_19682, partial [Pristionchus entomophagus]
LPVKKASSETVKEGEKAYPTTALGYSAHFERQHKSSLKSSGLYLMCSCGEEVRSSVAIPVTARWYIRKMCDGTQFTLHKLSEKTHSTPQCILCETYLPTVRCYAEHLQKLHNSSLRANGIYLICSCGQEVRSHWYNPDHAKKCDGTQFTLHKLSKEIPTTPRCVQCEFYPTTALGYAYHIKRHKSTLIAKGIYLICSCGLEVCSPNIDSTHNKKCSGTHFTLHKLADK